MRQQPRDGLHEALNSGPLFHGRMTRRSNAGTHWIRCGPAKPSLKRFVEGERAR